MLLHKGEALPLTPKVFDVLAVLVENSGHLLEREELLSAVWADSFVEEANITVSISALRKALGEDENGNKYIETVPKRGYRFIADVKIVDGEPNKLKLRRQPGARIIVEPEETDYQDEIETELAAKPNGQAETKASGRLRSQAFIACTVSMLLVVSGIYWWKVKQESAVAEIRSVSVLPFKVLGTSERDEYLGLGMADALITRLGSLNRAKVRPTSAVARYISTEQDPAAVGRELKVDAVLEGSIQRVNGHIRVTGRLVRVRNGEIIWADILDGNTADIFAVQDAMSERLAATLSLNPGEDQKRLLTKQYTNSVEANQAYIRGRIFWNKRTEEGLRKAIEYFEQAIDKDHGYALAYSGLADSYILLGNFNVLPPKEIFPKAKAAAMAAVQIDDTLAEAHTSLAYAKMNSDWDWPGAEREFRQALDLNYNYPTAHHWYSEYLAAMGRLDESLAEAKQALELDPQSIIINTNIGYILFLARRYDEAIDAFKSTLEMDPNFGFARSLLGQAYAEKGMWDEALAEWGAPVDSIVELRDGAEKAAVNGVYQRSGVKAYLNKRAEIEARRSRRGYASACNIGLLFAGCGKVEEAFNWLERAYEERDPYLVWLKVGPSPDALRSDPRFQDLLRRLAY